MDVREEDGRIIIEPIKAVSYTIDSLVASITEDNCHGPIDMGPPIGTEIW